MAGFIVARLIAARVANATVQRDIVVVDYQ